MYPVRSNQVNKLFQVTKFSVVIELGFTSEVPGLLRPVYFNNKSTEAEILIDRHNTEYIAEQ